MSAKNDHEDFGFEPIPGLPAHLPKGEHILWQGTPRWLGLLRHAFHARLVALYCAILVGWVAMSAAADGASATEVVQMLITPALLVVVLFTILAGLSYGLARSTIYTITSRRIVMRFGLVLPITINLPFLRIQSVALKRCADGTGDLPLQLKGDDRIAWLHLWPHVRPGRFSRPEPMLRDLADVEKVAVLLTEAMAEAIPAGRIENLAGSERPAGRPPERQRKLATA